MAGADVRASDDRTPRLLLDRGLDARGLERRDGLLLARDLDGDPVQRLDSIRRVTPSAIRRAAAKLALDATVVLRPEGARS